MRFKDYAKYYDRIYEDKDYEKEIIFLCRVIERYSPLEVKNILSLGCGTLNHEIILAKRGFRIFGIDKSKEMIKIAKEKIKKENLVDIETKVGDIRDFNIKKKFDFVMAMFNVIGYQIKNKDLERVFKSVSKCLKKRGLFVFDCWYAPAVLKDGPKDKIKEIGGIKRITKAKLNVKKNIIDIRFQIVKNKRRILEEIHRIRFWHLEELEYFLKRAGFKILKTCNFLDLNSKISENNWNIFIITRKN